MKTIINCTPHNITLNDGSVYPVSNSIVSALVNIACPDREDLICPATSHPDTVREN